MPETQDQNSDSPYVYEETRKPFSNREKTILSACLVAVGVVAGSQFILPAIANQIAMQSNSSVTAKTSSDSGLPNGYLRPEGGDSTPQNDSNPRENNFSESVGQFSEDVASFFGSAMGLASREPTQQAIGSTPSQISTPSQSAIPQPASSSVTLPGVSAQDWGNLSSATPYASASSGSASGGLANGTVSAPRGSAASSSWGDDDDRDDDDDHAREDSDEQDDRDEAGDDND